MTVHTKDADKGMKIRESIKDGEEEGDRIGELRKKGEEVQR